jgi:hypothetical protein
MTDSWLQDTGQLAVDHAENRFSTPVHYRPDGYNEDLNPQNTREYDLRSETSEGMEDSVVSSVVDKFGFIHSEATIEDKDEREEEEVVDIDLLRRRETKWLKMLEDWDEYMMKNYKKIRDRCRKGIPPSVRSRAWLYLCGAKYQMDNPSLKNAYKKLLQKRVRSNWDDDIEKDLHRNFPTHELFGGVYERLGQQQLYEVLKAYTVLNPIAGYCQAQAPIAALLLMHMPAEHALWCLVAICDRYIPGYYSNELAALQLDGDILFGLLKKIAPGVYRHLKSQEITPTMYMTEWFLCIFSRSLPWPSVLRIWDMFFCEGVKVLFRVGLVLLKYCLPLRVRK